MWLEGFQLALSGTNILWLMLGSFVGLIVGVLPGLGPTFGVALMLPFTFSLDPATALIFLCAIHAACNYGDSFSSIMLNVPGGPGTVASCWDGYPMAKQGLAGRALGIATLSSFIGGVGSWVTLALLARPITQFAINLGAPEYVALGVMALGLISVGSKGETIKGLVMACVGLMLSFVGDDPVTGLSQRFGFGIPWLEAGIPIIVSTLGIFAVAQVMIMMEEGGTIADVVELKDSVAKGFVDVVRHPITILRAGAVGWFIGIMPALGVGLAGIVSYLTEKRYSKIRDKFGTGVPDGLIAAEIGKGACVVGDLIPTFTLGIPGSVTGAILMVALIIHGVQPGPRFMASGVMPYTVFAGLLLAQALFIPTGLIFGKVLAKIVYLPNALLAPSIVALCFLGAYSERGFAFDLILVVAFGVLAYFVGKMGYPLVCLVLGLILGPLIETNFHRSLGISLGSYDIFWTRPVAVASMGITIAFLAWPFVSDLVMRALGRKSSILPDAVDQQPEQAVTWGEISLLGVLAGLMVLFLWTARTYRAATALFPNIACTVGLVLILVLMTGLLVKAKRQGGVKPIASWKTLPLFGGALDWRWSIGGMMLYVGGVYVLGFAIATAIFIMASAWLMGYKRRWVLLMTGVGVAATILWFASLVEILLPMGVFGG